MPIFIYTCNKCGAKFEFQHGFEDEPRCPKCKGKDLEKHSEIDGEAGGAKPGCSCCSPKPETTG